MSFGFDMSELLQSIQHLETLAKARLAERRKVRGIRCAPSSRVIASAPAHATSMRVRCIPGKAAAAMRG